MRELTIAGRRIADATPPFIICEIGHNHCGSLETAKLMFRAAADCGVDAVKLQKRDNKALFHPSLYNAPYNSEHAYGDTYGAHREVLEFGWDEYQELRDYAKSLGLIFFATAFDKPSADFLAQLGVPAFKIASGDLKNIPLIRYVASLGQPVIISTGGGTMGDVDRMYRSAWMHWDDGGIPKSKRNIAILHCTASYPCEPAELNLSVISHYRAIYPNTVIGFSDHQDGIDQAPVAYALGARIFEKHFTLNHTWKGSDHAFSLEPQGMKAYVRNIHRTAEALGDGVKRVYDSELAPLRKMQKSIVASAYLPVDHVLKEGDLDLQSPGGGLEPWKVDKMLGRHLRESVQGGQIIDSSGIVQ